MNETLPREPTAIVTHPRVGKKIELNLRRNKDQDQTAMMDDAAKRFVYADCKDSYWNPPEFSLLFGTPIWEGATENQRIKLNQLYWVAYYSQIISAEVATIFFNQTAAAGLYALEDFRRVCDTLDLESAQERAHINAFKTVSDQVEADLFGHRVFSWKMRGPYDETMVFPDTNALKRAWKSLQLRAYGMLSSGNAFIGCQYFTVRGLRTLNGKMVQQKLSQYYINHEDQQNAPIPSAISYYHYMDESFHFNSSCIIGTEVIEVLPKPTAFERRIANMGLIGCQKDHRHFSTVVNGLFWNEPATFAAVYQVLRSKIFELSDKDARELMRRTFAEENDGNRAAQKTHSTAIESYQRYLEPLEYVSKKNKNLDIMRATTFAGYLARNRRALARFQPEAA